MSANKKTLTEAQALREYLRKKAKEQQLNAAQLRRLVEKSSITTDEAPAFYDLIETMEAEAIRAL